MIRYLCAALIALVPISASAEDMTLITNVAIVDITGGDVKDGQSILIDGSRISAVGSDLPAPDSARRIDAEGAYVIPGLWDSHVHVFSTPTEYETAFPLYLINGVTGIRDMGALLPIAEQQALQTRIEAGEVLGPRLVLSGAWVDASPGSWPGMFLADTPDEARKVVTRVAKEGWAAVKSYSMLAPETYAALTGAAHAHGLQLVGHIPERVTLAEAIAAGQAGMEHFGRIPMACSTEEAAMIARMRDAMDEGKALSELFEIMADRNRILLESWDAELCARVLARMVDADIHVSPTLVVANFYTGARPAVDSLRMRLLPGAVREAWDKPDFRLDAMTDEVRALADASIALDRKTFRMAVDAGVPILASSDASFANPYLFHGFSLLDELDLYVAIGLTPREALYTGTIAPALFFGLADQDGSIAPDRRADLLLLDANPLDDLATLRRPRAVIAGGHLLDRKALDVMIARLEAAE